MTSDPTLALNGEAILLKNMRVTVSQQFQDKDSPARQAPQQKSEQGIKGKELRVSAKSRIKTRKFCGVSLSWEAQQTLAASVRNTALRMKLRVPLISVKRPSPEPWTRRRRMGVCPGWLRSL